MNTATIAAIIAIAAILFFAIRYIYKEKKKGNACIGCPYADSCQKHRQTACTKNPDICPPPERPLKS